MNKGEEAILAGILKSFSLYSDVKVSLLSSHFAIDNYRYRNFDIRVVDGGHVLYESAFGDRMSSRLFASIYITLKLILFSIFYVFLNSKILKLFKSKEWKEWIESDIIIVGHDSAFSLHFHMPIILFAKFLRKKVVIYGASLIIPRNSILKFTMKFVFDKVDLITLREMISYDNLKENHFDLSKVYVTADLAFLMSSVSPERINEIRKKEGIPNKISLIGMTVSQVMFLNSFPEIENIQQKYIKYTLLMSNLVDYMIEEFGSTIIIISHVIGPTNKQDDRIIAQDIYKNIKNKEHVKIIINEYNASELKGLIGQFDLFIGQRMHSVIAAMSMKVPAILISNKSPRTDGIIGDMLGQDRWILDIEKADIDIFKSRIKEAWILRDQTKEDLFERLKIIEKNAMINGELLKKVIY